MSRSPFPVSRRPSPRRPAPIRGLRALLLPAALLMGASVWASPSLAQGKLPAEAAEYAVPRGAAFIEALNDTSIARRREMIRDNYTAETLAKVPETALLDQLARLHREYAPLTLHHSEVSFRGLHVFARTQSSQMWHDFQFLVDPAPPYRTSGLRFIAEVAEPVALPNGSVDDPSTLGWIDEYIDKLRAENDLSGSVLLARGDRVFYRRTFGFADVAGTRPVSEATQFNLGSGNKMFTALVIVQLAEEGRLRLEDPIAKYFPDFPDPGAAGQITLRHLLSHSSGIGDYWTDYYDSHGRQVTTLAEMLPFVYKEIRDDGLYFEPGSAHRYSNSGFVLLGLVIEQVTGQSYYDAVAERIYRPLGLDHTDSYLYGSSTDLAQPMIRDESAPEGGAARWAEAPHGRRGTSAGGGYSTLDDMLRFARGLVGGAIVPRPVLAEMATMQPPIEEDFYGYGLGFLVQRSQTGGKLSFGHGGIAHGINFELRYFPSEDVTLVAFGNQDNGAYDDLRRNLVKLITGDR